MCQTTFLDDVLNCYSLAQNKTPSMAGSWLTQLAFAALSILLGMLFVAANTDFCPSVFETQIGKLALANFNLASQKTPPSFLLVSLLNLR